MVTTECNGNNPIASQTVTVLDGVTTKQVLKQMQSVESQSVACSTSAGTCTPKESHILKLKLLPDSSPENSCQNNLKFRIVPNDIRKFNGDCLFMALAQFLHPKCDPRDSLRFHCLIRQVIVNYLTREESDLATWKKYSIILKDNHQSRIKEFRNYAPESPCKVFHTKIQKAYKRYMIKEGNFGTMAELDAAMELFGFKTTLIQENHNPSEKQFSVYNIGNSQRRHHLYLLFTGHIDSGHFQKLELMTVTFCNVEVPVGNYQVDSHCEAHSFISLSKILPPNPDSEIKPSPRSFNEHKRSLNDNDHLNDLLQTTKRMKLEEREILPLPSDSDSSNGNSEGGVSNLEPGPGPGPGLSPGLDDSQYIPGDLPKSDIRGIRSNFLSSCFRNQNINEEGNNQKSKAFKSLPAAPASRLPAHYSEDVEDTKQGRGHAVTSFHMYLPPWSETPFQVLQSSIRVHIVDKSFLLMDIATATTPTVKNLILVDGIFDIQAGATYSLKNVTDHGICMKIFHP